MGRLHARTSATGWALGRRGKGADREPWDEDVTEVDLEATRAWMLEHDVRAARNATPSRSVRLLPPLISMWSRLPCLRAVFYRAISRKSSTGRSWISPVVLVNGRMDGVWKHEKKGRRVKVRIEAFGNLPRWARRAAEHEAEQLGPFLGGTLELSWR